MILTSLTRRACGATTVRILRVGFVFFCLATTANAQDVIEFLSGAKAKGKVVEIRKRDRVVVFSMRLGQRTVERTFRYAKIHAVTYRGKRYVLTKKAEPRASGTVSVRSPRAINELITQVGPTPPDWYDNVSLDFPGTLDLDWPMPAPKPWNNQKNMGQYIWDKINPNEQRWRNGIKLMHHLLSRHKDDAATSRRVMTSLGSMYFRFFQDYPRAAFWWRKAKVSPSSVDGISLAECYYQMGSRQMALKALDQKRIRVETLKLLGILGETRQVIRMAEVLGRQARQPQWTWLAAGDACRKAKNYEQAVQFYQRVIDSERIQNEQYDRRARDRARQSIDAIRQFELLDITQLDDGEYEAEAMAYEGPLAVRVTVRDGKMESVEVIRHKEKQYYSALRDVPAQMIAKQSVNNVDATSRATITAEAIISATAKALTREDSEGE